MASTIAIYTGDGTTTDFTVPFDYLAKKFVRVSVGLTVLEGGDYGDTSKDFYFLDKTTVRLRTPPQAGAEVTVRRYTSATDRIVSFKDASILKASDLDTSSIQTIHIAEEGRDVINDALIVDKEGNWDAKGHRIVNVGDAVNDGDAINFKLYKADAMGAYQSRIEAEKARDRAVEAETNAMTSEVAAEGSAELAKQWATKLDATVDDVDYSAKHYANKANEILTQGATDAVNKVAQEGDRQISLVTSTGTTQVSRVTTEGTKQVDLATAQANEATRQANLATAKATEAETNATSASMSATEADASAKNSANNASTATQQATLATQKATEAKTNADKAALSKDAAKVSETNAKESELKAKQYADQATTGQLQADWEQTDSTEKDFIKNKPTLGTLSAKNSLAYSELTGVPTSFTPSSHTHTVSQITDMPKVVLSVNDITPDDTGNVPLGLHTVATSGDYNDLTNKPSIPANTSNWSVSGGINGWARDNSTGFTIVWGSTTSDTWTSFARTFDSVLAVTFGAWDSGDYSWGNKLNNTGFMHNSDGNCKYIAVGFS